MSSNQPFTLLQPKIINLLNDEVQYCDTVKIQVANFPINKRFEVHFLNQTAKGIRLKQNEIGAIVPTFLRNKGNMRPIIEIANFTLISNKELTIKNPEVKLPTNEFTNFYDTLTIKYTNLNHCKIDVLFEDEIPMLINRSESELKVRIPAEINHPWSIPIQILVGAEVLLDDQLKRQLIVNNVTPSSAKPEEYVRIEGRGFQPIKDRNSIYFAKNVSCITNSTCRIRCEVIEASGRHILFKVPANVRDFANADGDTYLGIFTQNIGGPHGAYRINL